MKKSIGLALVPVLMATLPAFAADRMESHSMTRETVTTSKSVPMNYQTSQTTMTRAGRVEIGSEAQVQFAKGQWQLVEKNYPEAIRSFERALVVSPDYTRALEGLALAQYFRGDYAEAQMNIERAVTIDPIDTNLYLTHARILDAQSKDALALDSYLTFLSLEPQGSSVNLDVQRRANELFLKWEPRFNETQRNYYGGLRALTQGNPDRAIPMLKGFISEQPQIDSQVINAHRLLGVAYETLNRPTEAVAIWEVITKQQPQNPVGYYHLSTSYEQVGRSENAKQAWSNFVKFAPKSEATLYIDRPEFIRHTTTTTVR